MLGSISSAQRGVLQLWVPAAAGTHASDTRTAETWVPAFARPLPGPPRGRHRPAIKNSEVARERERVQDSPGLNPQPSPPRKRGPGQATRSAALDFRGNDE